MVLEEDPASAPWVPSDPVCEYNGKLLAWDLLVEHHVIGTDSKEMEVMMTLPPGMRRTGSEPGGKGLRRARRLSRRDGPSRRKPAGWMP